MTAFEIEELRFTPESVQETRNRLPRFSDWPVVYLLEELRRPHGGVADTSLAPQLKALALWTHPLSANRISSSILHRSAGKSPTRLHFR